MWAKVSIPILFLSSIQALEFPQFLKDVRCSLSNFSGKCYIESANKVIPILVRGVPDFDIPRMDPYYIPFQQAINDSQLLLNITNSNLYGLGTLKTVSVKELGEDSIFISSYVTENLTLAGEYSADGSIGLMCMRGSGPFSIRFENVIFNLTEVTEYYNKEGEQHYTIPEYTSETRFEKVVFNFEGLYRGNKVLGKQFNKILNEYESPLSEKFEGIINDHLRYLARRVINAFAKNVPIKDVYLP